MVRRERRLETDAGGQSPRECQHDPACRDRPDVGRHGDPVPVLSHGGHRCVEDHCVTELGCHGVGDAAHPAVELRVLVAPCDRHQGLDATRRTGEEEPIEQRDLGEIAGEAGADGGVDEVSGQLRGHPARRQPRGHRQRIPCAGTPSVPGGVDGHLLGHRVHASDRGPGAGEGGGVDTWDVAAVAAHLPAGGEHVIAIDERLEGGDAHLLGEGVHVVVGGADEAAAHVHRHPALGRLGPDAPADAVPRFEHDDRPSGLGQPPRRGEPGQACTDDTDVGLPGCGHRAHGAPPVPRARPVPPTPGTSGRG